MMVAGYETAILNRFRGLKVTSIGSNPNKSGLTIATHGDPGDSSAFLIGPMDRIADDRFAESAIQGEVG